MLVRPEFGAVSVADVLRDLLMMIIPTIDCCFGIIIVCVSISVTFWAWCREKGKEKSQKEKASSVHRPRYHDIWRSFYRE